LYEIFINLEILSIKSEGSWQFAVGNPQSENGNPKYQLKQKTKVNN